VLCDLPAGKRLRASGVTLSPVPFMQGSQGAGDSHSNGSRGSLKFAVPPRAVVYEVPEAGSLLAGVAQGMPGADHAAQSCVASSPTAGEQRCGSLAVAEGGLVRDLAHVGGHSVFLLAVLSYTQLSFPWCTAAPLSLLWVTQPLYSSDHDIAITAVAPPVHTHCLPQVHVVAQQAVAQHQHGHSRQLHQESVIKGGLGKPLPSNS
jgi:hypothetical protein